MILFEFGFSLSDAERKTTGLFDILLEHLIKLYLIDDRRLNKYHYKESQIYAQDILKILQAVRKKKIKRAKLEDWYFFDQIENKIQNLIIKVHNDYEIYPVRNYKYVFNKVYDRIDEFLDCFASRSKECIDKVFIEIKHDLNIK